MAAPINPVQYAEGSVISEAVTELKTLIPNFTALLSATSVRVEPNGFMSIVCQGDARTIPAVHVVNLTKVEEAKLTTLPFEKLRPGETVIRCCLNPAGKWCLQLNNQLDVWLMKVEKPKRILVSSGEFVQLISWLTGDIFVLVKLREILHIHLNGHVMQKFEMKESFRTNYTVTDYTISPNGLWTAAAGICLLPESFCGSLLITRLEKKNSSSSELSGLSGKFLPSNQPSHTLLVVADIKSGPYFVNFALFDLPGLAPLLRVDMLRPPDRGLSCADIPIAIKIIEQINIAFVATKSGFIHLFDVLQCKYLGSKQISTKQILALAGSNKNNGGVFAVGYDGEVRSIRVGMDSMVESLSQNFGKEQALEFAVRHNLSVPASLFADYFCCLLEVDYKRAVVLATTHLETLPFPEALRVMVAYLEVKNKRRIDVILRFCDTVQEVAGTETLVSMFETAQYPEGLFAFLDRAGGPDLSGALLVKFVQCAVLQNQFDALRRFVKKNVTCGEEVIPEFEHNHGINLVVLVMEYLVASNDPTPFVNTALLQLYIKNGKASTPKVIQILRENTFYDISAIAQQLESASPAIALMAYKSRLWDEEYIKVSNQSALFVKQINYLLFRRKPDLWAGVFSKDNPFFDQLLKKIIARFQTANRNTEIDFGMIKLMLEAMIRSGVSNNTVQLVLLGLMNGNSCQEELKFYETLFISTLLKEGCNSESLETYLTIRFQNYDHIAVGDALIAANFHDLAIKTLVLGNFLLKALEVMAETSTDLVGMCDLAEKSTDPQVWSFLGEYLLDNRLLVDSLHFFIRARNYSHYKLLYKRVESDPTFADWDTLISYFEGVKRTTLDPSVNSTLAVLLAKGNRFDDLEKHFKSTLEENVQQTQGCRICEDGLKEVGFSPCGHVVACSNCAQWLKECPVCRQIIQSKLRIFHA